MMELGLKTTSECEESGELGPIFSAVVYPMESPFLLAWNVYGGDGEWSFTLDVGFREETEIQFAYNVTTGRWHQMVDRVKETRKEVKKSSAKGEPFEAQILAVIVNFESHEIDDDAQAYSLIVATVASFLSFFREIEDGQTRGPLS
jgi:hypothetical protein